MNYNIATLSNIVRNIEYCVNNSKPFSLIRFGDGGLKLIERYYNRDSLKSISDKEGIPIDFFDELISGWRNCANKANYIDSPVFYMGDDIFSKRNKVSTKTKHLMARWEEIYGKIVFTNPNICNSEIGFMLFTENAKANIMDLLGYHDVCCITNFSEIEKILLPYVDGVTLKLIPGFYGNFYNTRYESLVAEIKAEATKYKIWLVGAGELGRLLTGLIKECGGVAIDIGKVFDVWVNRKINKRMRNILRLSKNHRLMFTIGDPNETIN